MVYRDKHSINASGTHRSNFRKELITEKIYQTKIGKESNIKSKQSHDNNSKIVILKIIKNESTWNNKEIDL